MRLFSRTRLALALTTLATGATLMAASPASAVVPNLYCDSGGNYRYACTLTGGSNEVWTYNGAHLTADDGKSSIVEHCTPRLNFLIHVSYVTSTGQTETLDDYVYCQYAWN